LDQFRDRLKRVADDILKQSSSARRIQELLIDPILSFTLAWLLAWAPDPAICDRREARRIWRAVMKSIVRSCLPTQLGGLPLPPPDWNSETPKMRALQEWYAEPCGLIESELYRLLGRVLPDVHLIFRGSRRWLTKRLIRTLRAAREVRLFAYPETLAERIVTNRHLVSADAPVEETEQERSIRRRTKIDPLLKAKGWSPWQWANATAHCLAEDPGQVSSSAVYKYLDGRTKKLNQSTRNRLAAALGVKPEELPS
jgi:hypothetical protein